MGRSKFTFPVPGRKQKPPFGPIVSGPMSKAQKILGTAEINIDAPRQWDTASNSGISVSVSETTATYTTTERSRGLRREEGGFAGSSRGNTQWEQESEIVPAYLSKRFSQMNTTDAGPRDFTETSSLTRRGSMSTITSWYDKAKMPLSISQQTSSSAMAKGLPQKANELLDIEGQAPNAAPPLPSSSKPKKRPGRLDLGPLLSRHRHSSSKTQSEIHCGRPLLGTDYVTKSPSLASLKSAQATPPPIQQRTEKKLIRRSTFERISEMASSGRPRTGSSSRRGANDISTLPNLYEHYEQMSFDQVLGHDGPLAAPDPSLASSSYTPRRSPTMPPTMPDQRKSVLRPALRRREETLPAPQPSYGGKPDPPNPTVHPPTSTDRDCGSSVSSRYTKTSKTSKRTSQSLNGSDLMEKSVLSLSSDSEDDYFPDSVSKSTVESQSSDAGSLAPSSLRSIGSRNTPSLSRSSGKSVKHASFAPTNTYLTIPSKSPPSKPPSVKKPPSMSARTSSLPPTKYQPPPPSSRSSSRYSTISTSTSNSAGDWQTRSGYGVQDARLVAGMPVHESHPNPGRIHERIPERALERVPERVTERAVERVAERAAEPPQRMLSTKSSSVHSVDQPTPPLSPTSTESFMTSTGSTATGSIDAHGISDSRYMAVTRQEEMLLAALRMKRARMRESLLTEYEDDVHNASPHHHQRNSSQGTITDMEWPEPPQTLRHQTSTTSNSTIKAGSRSSETHSGSLAGGRNHHRSSSRHLEPPSTSSHSGSTPSSRTSSLRQARRTQDAPPTEAKHERILLYLDRPVGNVSSMDFAEPSPDLSDFMDFDNGSDEEDELSSDPSLYRTRDQRFNMASKGRGLILRTSSCRRG